MWFLNGHYCLKRTKNGYRIIGIGSLMGKLIKTMIGIGSEMVYDSKFH